MIYGLFGKVLLSKVRILYADIHTQPFSGPLAAFASQSLYPLKKPITQKTEKKKRMEAKVTHRLPTPK